MSNCLALPYAAAGMLCGIVFSQVFLKPTSKPMVPAPAPYQVPAKASVAGTLGIKDFIDVTKSTKNQLSFHDRLEGRPVLMDAFLQSVTRNGDDITVTLWVNNNYDSDIHPVNCTFKKVTETSPLSGWIPDQPVQISGKFGTDVQTMTDCVLSAYVNAEGKPTREDPAWGMLYQDSRLSRSEVYPPLL